jgi:serine protease Do
MRRRLDTRMLAAGMLATLLGVWTVAATRAAEVPQQVLDAERQRIDAIATASQAAVSVFARGGAGGGSGVVITPDGYALTNYHVVKPAGDHMKCSMPDGNLYDAVIVGIDPTGDVALIKLLGRDDFPCATMGDSDEVRVGDWCFAVGNPFLLATDFQPTVTWGLVSGVHRYQYPAGTLLEYADCIQTDASINPGNSGGPLFNARGELIGINGRGSFEKRGRVNVGVGYAISINQIKNFMGYLRSGRIVDHATLGATVTTGEDGQVVVSNLLSSSDAARRGLEYGDVLLAFGGRSISTVNGFKNVLGIFPKGWRVPLSYRRDGQRYDTFVRLAGVHPKEELLASVQKQPNPPAKPGDKQPDGKEPQEKDKEEEKDPNDEQPEQEPRPSRPMPSPHGEPQAETPPEIAAMIDPKPGYANFYFNALNRDRVWESNVSNGDFTGLEGGWILEGDVVGGGAVQLVLEQQQVTGQFAGSAARLDAGNDLDQQLGPQGSGGLLVALHLWRRLLLLGPQRFGDVYYQGTVPLIDREGLFDTLVGTHNVIETRFMFQPDTGRLAAIEMYPDSNVDPCEVYFDDYRDVQGRMIPHQIQVRHGNGVFAEIQWKKIELPKPAEMEKDA